MFWRTFHLLPAAASSRLVPASPPLATDLLVGGPAKPPWRPANGKVMRETNVGLLSNHLSDSRSKIFNPAVLPEAEVHAEKYEPVFETPKLRPICPSAGRPSAR